MVGATGLLTFLYGEIAFMFKIGLIGILSVFIGGSIAVVGMGFLESSEAENVSAQSVYQFKVIKIDGHETTLDEYHGDILLIVNTASECGYTPQYKGLQAIYDKYKDRGFRVLGFPANNFGGQEPGSNDEIIEFCTLKYKVTFPMFAKISVKGEDQHPLYKFLTDKEMFPETGGDISWNFNKFLANDKGEIVARFSSKDDPESETVTAAIEKQLTERESAAAR